MQDSNSKLTLFFWLFIALAFPFVCYEICLLQPTFDDWTYLTYPNTDRRFRLYLLPYGSFWRPFDAAIGYLLGTNLKLFPVLNHVLVCCGHLFATIMVYLLCRLLKFRQTPAIVASLFFFVSPACLGAVTGIDSINQIYASAWGLASLYVYLHNGKHSRAVWLLLSLLATFSKENGIIWFIIPPIIGYIFNIKDTKTIRRDLLFAFGWIVAYAVLRLSLPHDGALQPNEEYTSFSLKAKAMNLLKFLVLSFCSLDFVSLFHAPSRNLPLLIVTALLSLPFVLGIFHLFVANCRRPQPFFLALSVLLAALPHLLTIFSTMHAYAALGLIALLTGWLLNTQTSLRRFSVAFALFLLSVLIVDFRHYEKAYESGQTGYRMAEEVIRNTHKPTHKAFCICIDRGEKKYSSFCVIPYDAFGWGNAVYFHTAHRWPQELDNCKLSAPEAHRELKNMIRERMREGFDHVWIVDGEQVKVIEP